MAIVLKQLVSLIIVGGVIRVLALSVSPKAAREKGVLVLRYSLVLRIFTFLSWPLMIAGSFYSTSGKSNEGSWILTVMGVFVFFAWLQIAFFKVTIDREKITIRGFWSGFELIPWGNVRWIREKPFDRQMIVETIKGKNYKLSTSLSGARELLEIDLIKRAMTNE